MTTELLMRKYRGYYVQVSQSFRTFEVEIPVTVYIKVFKSMGEKYSIYERATLPGNIHSVIDDALDYIDSVSTWKIEE